MKKLLALVLALVMTLGLATVGASAAYNDASSINEDYSEAIDVMSMIGVFSGMEDGSFNPTGALTREQGAKILTYMLLGKTGGDALTAGTAPYSDVAADRWSAGSIAYCTSEGIIAGDGKGSFNPTDELTGYAFAKMLLCALGYDAKIEGLTGNDWQINASKLAITAGLNDKLEGLAFGSVMTREKAAQMAFNAEIANMVYYANKGTEVNTSDGTSIVVGASAPEYKSNGATGTTNSLGETASTQFGEVYTTKLTKSPNVVRDGLQGTTYSYNGETSEWAMNGTLVADKKAGSKIAEMVDESKSAYIGYAMNSTNTVTINGATLGTNYASAAAAAAAIGTGYNKRGVEFRFQDSDNDGDWDYLSITADTVVKVTAAAKETTSGSVTYVSVGGIAGLTGNTVQKKFVSGYEGLEKGDYITYHKSGDYYYITKCDSFTGMVNAYSSTDKLTVDGTSYKMSELTNAASNTSIYNDVKGKAGTTIYTDAGGFVVAASGAEDVVDSTNTLYVVNSAVSGYSMQAKVLFPNGSSSTVTLNKIDSTSIDKDTVMTGKIEKFYTYTINSDGSYVLKTPTSGSQGVKTPTDNSSNNNTGSFDGSTLTLANAEDGDYMYTITKGKANFLTRFEAATATTYDGEVSQGVLATANTAFVIGSSVSSNDDTNSDKYTLYTGIANVPNVCAFRLRTTDTNSSKIAYLQDDNGYAIFVVAYNCNLDTTSGASKYAFLASDPATTYVSTTESYITYTGTLEGTEGNIEFTTGWTASNSAGKGDLVVITSYDGDRVDAADASAAVGTRIVNFSGTATAPELTDVDTIKVNGSTISFYDNDALVGSGTVNNNTKYWFYKSSALTSITLDDLDGLNGEKYTIQALKTSTTDETISELYVTRADATDVALAVQAYKTGDKTTMYGAGGTSLNITLSGTSAANYDAPNTGSTVNDIAGNSITLDFTVDPNALIYTYVGNTVADNDAINAANTGTITVTGVDETDQTLWVKVVNNTTVAVYQITIDRTT